RMNQAHTCVKFRSIRREGPWQQIGLFREREVESVSICRDCGRERPRRFRKFVAVEREGTDSQAGGATISLRRLARRIVSLSRARTEIRANGLIRRLGGVQAESEIEQLAHAALLRRSEEHTSELQSRGQLVCRLLLEKNNQHI